MKIKKVLAMVLSVVLLLQVRVFAASSLDFSDFPNDWSTSALEVAVANGLLQGSDGKINPSGLLTRVQLAAILTRAFGAEQTASLTSFSDVPETHWGYAALSRAVAAGFLAGSGTNMYPDRAVTRQEAMVVLARALKLEDNTAALHQFTDVASVSDWAKGPVGAMIAAGYVNGDNGNINPSASMTRAQFAQIMSNITKTYLASGQTYNTNVEGSVIISTSGVTLQDMTVTGDVIIADGVGSGDATLSNVTVEGRLVVRGGGSNSIHITNSRIASDVMLDNSNGTTRIVLSNSTISGSVAVSSNLTLEGNVTNLVLEENVILSIQSGTVDTLQVKDTAVDSNVIVSAGAVVTMATVQGDGTSFTGSGTVGTINVNANNVAVSTHGTKVVVSSEATGVTAGGKTVESGQTVTISSADEGVTKATPSGSGSSGSGGSSGGGSSSDDDSSSSHTKGFAGGRGTVSSPWQINTAAQLNRVRENLTAHYVLTANINLSDYNSWKPIGKFAGTTADPDMPDPSVAFTGSFDGGNYTISNLTITDSATGRGIGLFGCTAGNAVIKNLTVNTAKVSASAGAGVGAVIGMALQSKDKAIQNVHLTGTNTISGLMMVGGIVGGGYCGIDHCSATADVVLLTNVGNSAGILAGGMSDNGTHCSITSCTVSGGTITVSDNTGSPVSIAVVGGLTGCATDYDAIRDCTVSDVTITVPAGSRMIGGLVGAAGKTTEGDMAEYFQSEKDFTVIEDCVVANAMINASNASRVGGIVGSGFYYASEIYQAYYPVPAAMQIVDCTASGSITGEDNSNVGTVIGYIFRNSVVTSCIGNMSGASNQVGAADAEKAIVLEGLESSTIHTVNDMVDQTVDYVGEGQDEESQSANNQIAEVNGDSATSFAGGDGTEDSPYKIADANQLNAVRNDLTAHYTLTEDIDLSDYGSWMPIGKFAGTMDDPDMPDPSVAFTGSFDGKNYTISNLTITDSATGRGIGLFGCTAGDAVIKNLTVNTAKVSASVGAGVGAVVGMALQSNDKAIHNVHLTGTNTISGLTMVGGYCGIDHCSATADVVLLSNGGNSAGILAGGMSDNGTHCSITSCTVSGGTITVSDNTGSLASIAVVGGLTGCATDYDAIRDCTVSGVTITVPDGSRMIGGLVGAAGKTTEGDMADYFGSEKDFTVIESCTVTNATIYASNASRVGGIVGSGFYYASDIYQAYYPVPAAMQVVDCSASGSITGADNSNVGTIIGYAFCNSVVTSCTGNVSGASNQVGAADAAEVVTLESIDDSILSLVINDAA